MISTGSFLTETGASNKQSELVKKLTAAWEKKNSKTARAGGASLMALSLAACGGEDNTPFSQADVDAAKAEGVASVDITSDNTDVMLAQADYDAAIETAKTSNDADIAAAAKTEALTSADGTIYATVDAAYTAGSNVTNAAAVEAALTDASGVKHNNVDAAITSNDATVEADATASAEATLVAGSGFTSVADLLAAYNAAVAPEGAVAVVLTSGTDVETGFSGSSDTVTGAFGTVQSTDVIVDSSTTDSDTATLTVADDINVTISNIETVTFDIRDTDTASDIILDKVTGADNIVLKSSYGTVNIQAEKLGQGQKVTFADTDFTTISVDSGGTSDSATNNVHVVLEGAYTATLKTQETNNDVDGLTIETSGGASTITLTAADDFIASTVAGSEDTEFVTAKGDSNLTLAVDQQTDATGLDGAIVNNEMSGDATLTVKIATTAIAAGELDLSKVSADTIDVAIAASATTSLKLASGANVKNTADQNAANVDLVMTTATEDSTLNFSSTVALDATGLKTTNFDIVNINGDADSTAEDYGDIEVTNADIGDSVTLNVTTGGGIEVGAVAAAAGSTLAALNVTGEGAFTGGALAATSIDIDAKTITAATLTGVVDLNATGAITVTDAITGAATITSTTGKVDIDEIASTGKDIVINMNDQAGVAEDATNGDGVVAGTVTINGAGTFVSDDDFTVNTLTVTGAVALDTNTDSNTITGDFASTSSKAATINVLTGDISAADATGGITVASLTGADGQNVTTGSGDDSITLAAGSGGSSSWVIATGAGNDIIDASGETTDAVSANGGAGIDTITTGQSTSDVLTGGSGTDTFVFTVAARSGATEEITDFEVGSAGDVIKVTAATGFSAALTTDDGDAGYAVVKVDTTDASATTLDNDDLYLLTGTGYTTLTAAASAFEGSSGVNAGGANNDSVVVVWMDSDDSNVYVSNITSDGTNWSAGTTLVELGGVDGLTGIAAMTADNFVIV